MNTKNIFPKRKERKNKHTGGKTSDVRNRDEVTITLNKVAFIVHRQQPHRFTYIITLIKVPKLFIHHIPAQAELASEDLGLQAMKCWVKIHFVKSQLRLFASFALVT